ncbi:hypothetical protein D9757_009255 [Collybiopsis confluens]|uniref:Domain of unknown function at the cortex 1 domain-containing protein n=1 Tax=Collybiopsis confluens TaxID=2823264 RepID=A0A8H5HAP1_9AGAR|nr:hypothetical protein D9757_009255 [Collybiopsis confluens]
MPARIGSDLFEGQVIANIKGLNGDCEYFERDDRKGVTWSRFLHACSADDIMFGNTFDRPLHLPWGSGAALKFMSPGLFRLWSQPCLTFAHTHISPHSPHPEPSQFPSTRSLQDDNSQLYLSFHPRGEEDDAEIVSPLSSASSSSTSLSSGSSHGSVHSAHSSHSSGSHHSYRSHSSSGSMSAKIKSLSKASVKPIRKVRKSTSNDLSAPVNLTTAAERRHHFSVRENRRNVVFGPKDVITTDFCYGFLEFAPSLTLRLPGGISFDLLKYWDGQPVRFVCCERKKEGDGGEEPWGEYFGVLPLS